jgi:hypothetical protein
VRQLKSVLANVEITAVGEKVAGSGIGPHGWRYMEFKVRRRKRGLDLNWDGSSNRCDIPKEKESHKTRILVTRSAKLADSRRK